MNSSLNDEKEVIRKNFALQRSMMSPALVQTNSIAICNTLSNTLFFDDIQAIVAYYPFQNEVNILQFVQYCLNSGKQVFFPKFLVKEKKYTLARITDIQKDFSLGHFGIFEPANHCEVFEPNIIPPSVWLIPGIAFDLHGTRVGRGAGYYDRLLENNNGYFLAVAFEQQVIENIPSEKHDVPMHALVSELRFVKFKEEG
ncbi:MAG: 5-formyltetrahydrofolate cyclo-ligase [Lentisphaeria bacterium]